MPEVKTYTHNYGNTFLMKYFAVAGVQHCLPGDYIETRTSASTFILCLFTLLYCGPKKGKSMLLRLEFLTLK
jgi:hypothetical protein